MEQKTDKFQKFLDWMAQPMSMAFTREQAEADAIVIRAYWEGIALREQAKQPQQHLHLHGVDERNMEKARIMKKRVCDLTPDEIEVIRDG